MMNEIITYVTLRNKCSLGGSGDPLREKTTSRCSRSKRHPSTSPIKIKDLDDCQSRNSQSKTDGNCGRSKFLIFYLVSMWDVHEEMMMH